MQARTQSSDIFKVVKEQFFQLSIREGEIKMFSGKQKLQDLFPEDLNYKKK